MLLRAFQASWPSRQVVFLDKPQQCENLDKNLHHSVLRPTYSKVELEFKKLDSWDTETLRRKIYWQIKVFENFKVFLETGLNFLFWFVDISNQRIKYKKGVLPPTCMYLGELCFFKFELFIASYQYYRVIFKIRYIDY